ncbi:MAG: hypothetical protein K1X75_13655 [Leptospirales bacterium]|nr:hypothetical protein [Leptospirales bacterium]
MDSPVIRQILEAVMPAWTVRIGLSLSAPFRDFEPWSRYQEATLLSGAATGSIDAAFVAAEDAPQSARELIELLEPIASGGVAVMDWADRAAPSDELDRAAGSMGMRLESWTTPGRLGVADASVRKRRLAILRKAMRSGGRALSGRKIQIALLLPAAERALRMQHWRSLIYSYALQESVQLILVENGVDDAAPAHEAAQLDEANLLIVVRHWRSVSPAAALHSAAAFSDADALMLDGDAWLCVDEVFPLYASMLAELRSERPQAALAMAALHDPSSARFLGYRPPGSYLINRACREALLSKPAMQGLLPEKLPAALKRAGARLHRIAARAAEPGAAALLDAPRGL